MPACAVCNKPLDIRRPWLRLEDTTFAAERQPKWFDSYRCLATYAAAMPDDAMVDQPTEEKKD